MFAFGGGRFSEIMVDGFAQFDGCRGKTMGDAAGKRRLTYLWDYGLVIGVYLPEWWEAGENGLQRNEDAPILLVVSFTLEYLGR